MLLLDHNTIVKWNIMNMCWWGGLHSEITLYFAENMLWIYLCIQLLSLILCVCCAAIVLVSLHCLWALALCSMFFSLHALLNTVVLNKKDYRTGGGSMTFPRKSDFAFVCVSVLRFSWQLLSRSASQSTSVWLGTQRSTVSSVKTSEWAVCILWLKVFC